MWTQYAGHLMIPAITIWQHPCRERKRLLPLRKMGRHGFEICLGFGQGELDCRSLYVIGDDAVERSCVYCQNSLQCSLHPQIRCDLRLLPDYRIGWQEGETAEIQKTCEVPFLAVLPQRQWRVAGFSDDLQFVFRLVSLRSGINRVRGTDFDYLRTRPDLCRYIYGKHSGNGADLRKLLLEKLDSLQNRLAKFATPEQFEEEIQSLRF